MCDAERRTTSAVRTARFPLPLPAGRVVPVPAAAGRALPPRGRGSAIGRARSLETRKKGPRSRRRRGRVSASFDDGGGRRLCRAVSAAVWGEEVYCVTIASLIAQSSFVRSRVEAMVFVRGRKVLFGRSLFSLI